VGVQLQPNRNGISIDLCHLEVGHQQCNWQLRLNTIDVEHWSRVCQQPPRFPQAFAPGIWQTLKSSVWRLSSQCMRFQVHHSTKPKLLVSTRIVRLQAGLQALHSLAVGSKQGPSLRSRRSRGGICPKWGGMEETRSRVVWTGYTAWPQGTLLFTAVLITFLSRPSR